MYMYNPHIYITDDMKQRYFVEQAGKGASSALVCLNSSFFFGFFLGIIEKVEQAYCNIHFFLEGFSHERKEGIRSIKL